VEPGEAADEALPRRDEVVPSGGRQKEMKTIV